MAEEDEEEEEEEEERVEGIGEKGRGESRWIQRGKEFWSG